MTVFSAMRSGALVQKRLPQLSSVDGNGGWWPILREPYAGAWQSNVTVELANVLTNPTVYACITLIAADISKMLMRLVAKDEHGIWNETESPAFSPVLKTPNRYQNPIEFFEYWMISKLSRGNTYGLKARDNRNVTVAVHILDPSRVQVLVAPDGSVYYELKRDELSELTEESVVVPASEIIHDKNAPLYHRLVGLSPIHACGLQAVQGLRIAEGSTLFFTNGSKPGGVLTAPGHIQQETANRIKAYWDTNFSGDNVGKIAVLGDGLKYEPMAVTAEQSQLTDQLKTTDEAICRAFGVPAYMVGVGPWPTLTNIEALTQQYYNQCLQKHIEKIELALDKGLELPKPLGTEFDLSGLIRMDTAGRMAAASEAIKNGLSPNEVRLRYHDAGPVRGGNLPFMQEQNWPIQHLAERPLPQREITPPKEPPAPPVSQDDSGDDAAKFNAAVRRKALAAGLYAA